MFYLLKLGLVVLVTLMASSLIVLLGIFDAHGKRVYRINQFWTWIILRVGGVSLKVVGLEQIDPRQQYVFMVNHQSNIDIPVLVQALLSFQLRWIAKRELLWVPFFGWAMWASKHIIVDRANRSDAIKSLQRARQRIAAGISVVVFPEGTRSRDGKLLQFKKGGFLLALQTGRPIVPVTINGSRHVLAPGAWRLKSGTVEVTIDQPIAVSGFRPGNLRILSGQVRQTIERHLQPAPGDAENAREMSRAIDNAQKLERRSV